ncbi:MAG: FliM/FliN family flagellar motor switch protein [Leptospiraceae bacterium]|nr:FliM/FliN family flagellar motor switch protein [Leptospiraceae bacterium]
MSKTAESVWENCLSFIKDNIQEQAYKTWFEPIKSVELTDNALYIQVPSKFFYEWLEEHYVKLLKVALTKELGKNAKLLYKIKMENTSIKTDMIIKVGDRSKFKCTPGKVGNRQAVQIGDMIEDIPDELLGSTRSEQEY